MQTKEMSVSGFTGIRPYSSPVCRVVDFRVENSFLASGDFGQGGYPGDDLDPGDEYDF